MLIWFLVKVLFLLQSAAFLLCPYMADERGHELSRVSSSKNTNAVTLMISFNLNYIFIGPHLHIKSLWGLRHQHMNLGARDASQSVAQYILRPPVYDSLFFWTSGRPGHSQKSTGLQVKSVLTCSLGSLIELHGASVPHYKVRVTGPIWCWGSDVLIRATHNKSEY